MEIKETNVNDKKEAGIMLYNNILNKVHNNNVDEMYEYFKKKVERIEYYGNTPEDRMINYCSFKRDIVLRMYR